VVISEHDAIAQLRGLISPFIELSDQWMPFISETDDRLVYDWVKHEDNGWCSGKKEDFEMFLQMRAGYEDGDYARSVLEVFGIKVK